MTNQPNPEAILRTWADQSEQRYHDAKHAIIDRLDRLDWAVLPDYWQAQYKYLLAVDIKATLEHPSAPEPLDIIAEVETNLREQLLRGFLRERSTAAVSRAQGESNEDAARALLHTELPRLRAHMEAALQASHEE